MIGSRAGNLLHRERVLYAPQLGVALVAMLGIFAVIFGIWTATSVWSFPRFVLAVVMLMYLPGKVLLDIASVRLKPLEDLTLSLVLGMTVSSALYWGTAFLALPYLFALWPLATATVYFYRRKKGWHEIRRFRVSFDLSHILLLGLVILSLIPLVLLPIYYRNATLLPQGAMTFVMKPKDPRIHLAIANELTHSIPPQFPFVAGKALGYHYFMDLLVAMLSNSAWLSTLDLTFRFMPTFFFVMTVWAVFCFSRVWLGSAYAAALASFLVIFGEDFSFIPGLLVGSPPMAAWSGHFFVVPTAYCLYLHNSCLPALGILFSGLFCLLKFCEEKRKAWLILTAFLFAILMEYRVSVTAHVLISLAMAGFIYILLFRDARLLKVLALTALLAAPLVLYNWLGTGVTSTAVIRIVPLPFMPPMLERLGLLETAVGYHVNALFAGGPVTFAGLAALCLIALPAYLVGSLGLRVMAIPAMLKALIRPNPSTVVRFFVVCFIVLGTLITSTCTLTPRDNPGAYNNGLVFYAQSKYVLWLFATELMLALCRRERRRWQALVVCTVVILAIPSTAEYFERCMAHQQLMILERNQLELISYLDAACADGQVILASGQEVKQLSALTRCRIPVPDIGGASYLQISRSELALRSADQDDFWRAWTRGELRTDILGRYEVAYVVLDKRDGVFLPSQVDSWIDESGQAEDELGSMRSSFENDDFAVYEVSLPPLLIDHETRHPLWRDVGEVVGFVAYNIEPGSLRAGETVHITVWWQALAEMDRDYTVFIQVVGRDGRIWGQHEGLLRRGGRPTSEWKIGWIARKEFELELGLDTPPGGYRVETGLYYRQTGEHLPVRDATGQRMGDDLILLGSITVTE